MLLSSVEFGLGGKSMQSKFMGVATALALAVAWPTSSASAGEGLYVSGHAFSAVAGSSDTKVKVGAGLLSKGNTSYDYGLGGGAALGYSFPEAHSLGGFRVEVEFDFFRANPDKHKSKGGAAAGLKVKVSGSVNQYSFFANGYRDFDELKDVIPSLTPYLGLGLGMSIVDVNGISLGAPVGTPKISDTDAVFAFQVITGLAYEIMPKLVLGGEYRFIMTSDTHIKDTVAGVTVRVRSDNFRHVFGLTLRYYIN